MPSQQNKSDISQCPPVKRDRRLDIFRGFAVLTIFINHVPGNAFEHYTSRNWGFSDAAEAFVLMSGIAVGLAYTGTFQRNETLVGLKKMWARAFKLYWSHLLVIAACFIILAVSISVFDAERMVRAVSLKTSHRRPCPRFHWCSATYLSNRVCEYTSAIHDAAINGPWIYVDSH